MRLTQNEENYIRGYAQALQDMMLDLTGENSCGKSYDPCEFEGNTLHSYAFNLKDGGRHHSLDLYSSVDEITELMRKEANHWCEHECMENK